MASGSSVKDFSFNQWLYVLTIVASTIILADFLLPGKAVTSSIADIKKERQQYYNAARNFHYTYKIVTDEDSFTVSADFAKETAIGQEVTYSLSPLFKEVDGYAVLDTKASGLHSFRLLSGLVFPLLCIVVMLLTLRRLNNMSILSFVFQVLLVADLIYLLK